MKGSPVYPGLQLHIGLWLMTWHRAFNPHVPGHGSAHFWLTHALLSAHSELTIHSGLHAGGEPIYPDWQEHTAWLLTTRQMLNGPQGFGEQGCFGLGGADKQV